MDPTLEAYQALPFQSQPMPTAHVDVLATAAHLAGLTPPPIDHCRVLELGCAEAGNLLPMAESLPGSQFTGVDLSPRQIAAGQKIVDAIGLTNLSLRALDLSTVNRDFGEFDYIICHGVHSWVSPAVQDKILSVCSENLAPNGVVYLSYNCQPGWHRAGQVRSLMSFHDDAAAAPLERVRAARQIVDFLAGVTGARRDAYGSVWLDAAKRLRESGDAYVFHEYLEPFNQPIYFRELAARAAQNGLQYLGEAGQSSNSNDLSPEAYQTLLQLSGDAIELEQYLDFLRERMFRRTLLCRQSLTLQRRVAPARLAPLAVEPRVEPAGEADLRDGVVMTFRGDGAEVDARKPLIKALLCALHATRPRSLPLDELARVVEAQLGPVDAAALASAVLNCHHSNLLALQLHPPRFVLEPGPQPRASALARHQAAGGNTVSSLRHRSVLLSEPVRQVLLLCDGKHSRAAIAKKVGAASESSLQRLAEGALLLA